MQYVSTESLYASTDWSPALASRIWHYPAPMAGPPGGDGALRVVQDNEQQDQHGVPPDPSVLAARTKTAESKKKGKTANAEVKLLQQIIPRN